MGFPPWPVRAGLAIGTSLPHPQAPRAGRAGFGEEHSRSHRHGQIPDRLGLGENDLAGAAAGAGEDEAREGEGRDVGFAILRGQERSFHHRAGRNDHQPDLDPGREPSHQIGAIHHEQNELERIALDTLTRLDMEARKARQSQDEKIRTIESRVNDCEQQLTRLSGLYRRLEPLVRNLDSILTDAARW